MAKANPSEQHCMEAECRFQEDKDGRDQLRCNLCCVWFHIECVGVPKKEKNMVWTCHQCRNIYPTVSSLKDEVKQLRVNQEQLLALMAKISDQLQTETALREKTEQKLIDAKSQLTELAKRLLDKESSQVTERRPAPPSAPPLKTPSAPLPPNLLLGTSLLRNVDPKKINNWDLTAIAGASIDRLHENISSQPEDKVYDKIVIVGGSIDLEQKEKADIVLDYQALLTSASLRGHTITISSIPPRDDKDLKVKTKDVNDQLKEMCNKEGYTFIDNDPSFFLMNGEVNEALLSNDRLHLSKRGCDTLLKNLGILQSGSAFTNVRYQKPDQNNTLLFRGHESPFSNFFEVPITSNGRQFPSAEVAYQYCKAETMGDNFRAKKILHAKNGLHAMRIASQVRTDERWQEKKLNVMEDLIKEKLHVCEQARSALLESESKEIVEDTPHEFWGRGKSGQGKNMLGKIWMRYRENMKNDPNFPEKRQHQIRHRRQWATRQQQPRCYKCGETGHVVRQCRKQQTVSCYSCGVTGHKQKHCFHFSRTQASHYY